MSGAGKLRDPWAKALMRHVYGAALAVHAVVTAHRRRGREPRLFYGGARAGDIGGPLVKVQRLMTRFPEHRLDYNLVYVLSNAPYLPDLALRRLKRAKIPIVHNQNGVFYEGWFEGDWRAMNARMARTYHAADYVLWQSEFCRTAADRFLGVRQGPGEVLYNAVDTRQFAPATERPQRPFTFLVTGKIGTHLFYRLESSIQGLAGARRQGLDAALRIAGLVDTEAEAAARRLAGALKIGEAVRFDGPYRQTEAPDVYRRADAYIMTKHNDPCPNTVLEAMACGLPVLYASSGGVPELVGRDAGVGLEVPDDWAKPHAPSADAIASGMIQVAAAATEMGKAARARAVARFDLDHWLARHAAIFRNLLEPA